MARDARSPASPAARREGPRRGVRLPAEASCDGTSVRPGTFENLLDVLERVGLFGFLVGAPAQHAREAQGDAGTMPRRCGDSLESQLEHVHRFDVANRAEPLPRVPTDPSIHFANL